MQRCRTVIYGWRRRYSALKSLGEKKACFNEYAQQRKADEVLERKLALKKAREDFAAMLEEASELKAATRLSQAERLLELDPRWKVITPALTLSHHAPFPFPVCGALVLGDASKLKADASFQLATRLWGIH